VGRKYIIDVTALRFLFLAMFGLAIVNQPALAEPVKITLGYQSLWATSGEVYEVLRHTNILELNGIKADFKTFTFGGPLGEAAVAGEIDNIFAADAPVLRAAARIPGSKIFFRTHDARFGILVQADFQGTRLQDLKGKKLSGPFGTTTFPRAIRAVVAAGVKDPFSEMTIINQDIAEQVSAMQSKLVDAVTTWDPTMQRMLDQKIAKILWEAPKGENTGMQAISGNWLKAHSESDVINFTKAWIMATWWTSHNVDQAHQWFAATSRLSPDLLKLATDYDRNMSKPIEDINKINLTITDEDIESTQQVMDFLYERKLLSTKMDVKPYFDMGPLKKAQEEIAQGKLPDLKAIKIVTP
jgi:ABC-type nitrate/sulfonate/bicarbonate transport system substrate-binding protein